MHIDTMHIGYLSSGYGIIFDWVTKSGGFFLACVVAANKTFPLENYDGIQESHITSQSTWKT